MSLIDYILIIVGVCLFSAGMFAPFFIMEWEEDELS